VADGGVIGRASKADRIDPATGIVFDSKGELGRWHELQLLQRAGEISELRRQVSFYLHAGASEGAARVPILIRSDRYKNGRQCKLTVDFAYRQNREDVFEDWKAGPFKEADRLRIAIAEAEYGIRIKITGRGFVRRKRRLRSRPSPPRSAIPDRT
jgi:hypothetical protein